MWYDIYMLLNFFLSCFLFLNENIFILYWDNIVDIVLLILFCCFVMILSLVLELKFLFLCILILF